MVTVHRENMIAGFPRTKVHVYRSTERQIPEVK